MAVSEYNVLQPTQHPVCIKVRGSDGSVDHSVTTVGLWVFDSTETHALPLCQASLDRCAGATFNGCVQAFQLTPSKKLEKALGRLQRKRKHGEVFRSCYATVLDQ